MNAYFRPPDDYEGPTRCERCGGVIAYGPVIGGHVWMHVARSDHDVVMRPSGWWDTATGTVRYGNGRDRLASFAATYGESPDGSAT